MRQKSPRLQICFSLPESGRERALLVADLGTRDLLVGPSQTEVGRVVGLGRRGGAGGEVRLKGRELGLVP